MLNRNPAPGKAGDAGNHQQNEQQPSWFKHHHHSPRQCQQHQKSSSQSEGFTTTKYWRKWLHDPLGLFLAFERIRSLFSRKPRRFSAWSQTSDGSNPRANESFARVSVVGLRSPRSMKVMACRLSPEISATAPNERPAARRVSRSTSLSAAHNELLILEPLNTLRL